MGSLLDFGYGMSARAEISNPKFTEGVLGDKETCIGSSVKFTLNVLHLLNTFFTQHTKLTMSKRISKLGVPNPNQHQDFD